MTLWICGIDEAGYGPMLGPLCVSACTIRIEGWREGDEAPDLWDRLSDAVCRVPRDRKRRIPVGDSKKLKRPNQVKTGHPLMHLERGVLAALHASGWGVESDAALFDALDADAGDEPWFHGDPVPLPLSRDAEALSIDTNLLRSAFAHHGVGVVDFAVEVVGVDRFNELIHREGTKAATTGLAIATLLRRVQRRWSAEPERPALRVVCDRQSGRSRYSELLRLAYPDAAVEPISESDDASTYALAWGPAHTARAAFQVEAEEAHLPVALASMAAKLVRELAMARFNRYWSARVPELKPTAGYVQDARRWLHDVREVVTRDEYRRLVRRA